MTRAVFAGSFDPFTLGHKDIASRASKLFDEIIIAVAEDTGKNSQRIDKRMDIAKASVGDVENVVVTSFDGLLTDFMDKNGCNILLRGVRTAADYEYERSLMAVYRSLKSDIEIVLLPTKAEFSHISSTVVRELCALNASLGGYVDTKAEKYIRALYGVK